MKKIALLLAALMLLALTAIPASANGGVRFYLTGNTTAKVGDTVKVTLHIDGEFEAHIINVSIFFDNTSLRYVGKKNLEAYQAAVEAGGQPIVGMNQNGDAIALGIMMLTDPATEPGEFVELTFEVISTASSKAPFTILVDEFKYMPVGDTSGTPIPFTAEPFSITVTGGTGTGTTPAPTERAPRTTNPAAPTPAVTIIPTQKAEENTPAPGTTPDPGSVSKNTEVPSGTPDPETGETKPPSETAGPDATPGPDETADPDATPGPDETPAPGESADPFATSAPSESIPESSPDPDGREKPSEGIDSVKDHFTPQPGESGEGSGKALKTGLIIGGSAILAAAAALAAILVIRKKKNN